MENMDNIFDDISSLDNIDSLLNTIDGLYQTEQQNSFTAAEPLAEEAPVICEDYSPEGLEAAGFNEPQIAEITLGLKLELPVSRYANLNYTWKQMQEIRLGLHARIDTSLYENPLYSVDQMHELRMGILNHVNASLYANLMLSATDMKRIRLELSEAAYREHPRGYGYSFADENSGLIIRIADDCMDAYIKLPETVSDRFSTTRLTKILKNHEITFGILPLELERFSKELPRNTEVKIAHGLKSEPGTNGKYEYFFNTHLTDAPRINADGTVDYTHVKIAETVQAGQCLAVYHPAKQCKVGSTVTGIALRENSGQDLPTLTGNGILYDPESHTYKAAYAGNITFQEESYLLNVWKTYTITGDATRYSGSTVYDGTVIVRGDVRNMAKIKATGDIIVDGTVEGAELYSGHNILVRGGVNAGGKGMIQAIGNITGSFFESANMKSGGPIEGNYFLGCNIQTDDKILAKGGKSLIQGGALMAALGIEATNFRSYGGSKTRIEVGNTSDLLRRKKELSKRITLTTDEIRKLRDGKYKLIQLFGEEHAESRSIYQQTCVALEQKENHLERLNLENEHLDSILQRTALSYIKITGSMQAGILVVVNGFSKLLEEDLKKVTVTSENLQEGEEAK